jgi:UDP-2-acetamido-3-amino-2,3-dideoxy-glucuronate N-acetyltransferase
MLAAAAGAANTSERWRMIGDDVTLGKNVKIYHPELVNLYGCVIGDGSKIASFVEIGRHVRIGKNCKIEAFAFIPEGVTIEDGVFIGPHACFTNDKLPRAVSAGGVSSESDWTLGKTIVRAGASIGANATIVCGVTIGRDSLVGAGSVVTRDVADGAVVIGNPARAMAKH